MKHIIAIVLLGLVILAGCINQGTGSTPTTPVSTKDSYTLEESFDIANAWVQNSPTYAFDGSGIKYVSSNSLNRCPSCYSYTFTFDSSNAGYGNRNGQAVAQVVTTHTIEVLVNKGAIESAVIDGKWDEIGSKLTAGNENTGSDPTQPGTVNPGTLIPTPPVGNPKEVTLQNSQKTATDYVARTATFGTDSHDIQFISSNGYTCELCWIFKFTYISPSEGYGSRAKVNNTRETTHTIEIITSKGIVTSAVVDGKYDEVNGKSVGSEGAGIANPASKNCIDKGFYLTIITDDKGGESAICTKPGFSVCDEWAYFRGECNIVPSCNVSTDCKSGNTCYYYKPCQTLSDGTKTCGMERGDGTCHAICNSDSDCTGGLKCREMIVNAPEATTRASMCLWENEGVFCGGVAGFPCPEGYDCKLDENYPDAGGTCAKKTA